MSNKLTNQQVLKLAIEKAKKQGWKTNLIKINPKYVNLVIFPTEVFMTSNQSSKQSIKEFEAHKKQAHGGKSNVNCPFCRAYKNKLSSKQRGEK